MPEAFCFTWHQKNKKQIKHQIKPLGGKNTLPDIILSEAPSLVNTLSIGVSLHTSAGT